MLTTDPLYYKALLPVITIKNTANSSTLYTYSSFTGTATVITTASPLYCSVSLSQNTHGTFTIQFEDPAKAMESTITVGSRVQIDCGKQSGSVTRLISGFVRTKGYSRGVDGKVLYTISGSSTAIRFNERVIYSVSEAAKLGTGQIDITDLSRQADNLLNAILDPVFISESTLTKTGLVSNSDVETFIASIAIEYGEVQDAINYIEDQSGGETIVDTNDLVHFRHELKTNLVGRGFTIMNSNANKANHDADDTMYLVNKNWSYDDSFYKSDVYSNRLFAVLGAEGDAIAEDWSPIQFIDNNNGEEYCARFRPTHSHFLPGDIFVSGRILGNASTTEPPIVRCRIIEDNNGVPVNTGGVVVNIDFSQSAFTMVSTSAVAADPSWTLSNLQAFYNPSNVLIPSFDLDTTKNYWFLLSNDNFGASIPRAQIQTLSNTLYPLTLQLFQATTKSTNTDGGTGYTGGTGTQFFVIMPTRRSQAFVMWDPKAALATQSGFTNGLFTDTNISDASTQIKTKDAMYRYLSQQLHDMSKPRTVYNFPTVSAPNIPPVPGDPIVISDTVLGFSTSGNQVVLTTCGDMTYTWGNMGSGSYEAPTILNINAVGVHPKYR